MEYCEYQISINIEIGEHKVTLLQVTREFSMSACLVVMTLPVIRLGAVPAPLYLGWLDTLTRGLPPTLLIRGNQESVLTFYS